jgi:hypothetical protein
LWIALWLILGVNVGVDNTGCWTRVIGRGVPRRFEQPHLTEFLQSYTTPVGW